MNRLNRLTLGDEAVVNNNSATGALKRRFLDIGLIKGTRVKCVAISPHGDPKAFLIRGAVIALRNTDSSLITVGEEYEE